TAGVITHSPSMPPTFFSTFICPIFLISLLQLCFLQVPSDRILPGGQRLEAILNQLALVQSAIEWARSFAQSILRRSHRRNLRFQTILLVELTAEVIPGNIPAFV